MRYTTRTRPREEMLMLAILAVIATSGPSSTYPSRVYRNPIEDLVGFLDYKHGAGWAIWEFRAEGTGYPDEAVYGRVSHFPWPDHHPPPFGIVPAIIGGMRNWLNDDTAGTKGEKLGTEGKRVVVVHCKAGKGRSGTMGCSYLMAEEGWKREDALQRFTERRMRPGFGGGVTIPSQLRWLTYVERWRDHGKLYMEQQVEVTEVHVWGLRPGVKIAIEGYVENGRKIETLHVFTKEERDDIGEDEDEPGNKSSTTSPTGPSQSSINMSETNTTSPLQHSNTDTSSKTNSPTSNTIFRPSKPVILPTNDINLACERRAHAGYGWTLVTSVAHVWFNTFFEGNGPENCDPALQNAKPSTASSANARPDTSGVFDIHWDAMDGIKGSSRKGKRSFDRVAVVWRVVSGSPTSTTTQPSAANVINDQAPPSVLVVEPPVNASIPALRPAKLATDESELTGMLSGLGLRHEAPDSANVSKAPSEKSSVESDEDEEESLDAGHESDVDLTQTHGPRDEDGELLDAPEQEQKPLPPS